MSILTTASTKDSQGRFQSSSMSILTTESTHTESTHIMCVVSVRDMRGFSMRVCWFSSWERERESTHITNAYWIHAYHELNQSTHMTHAIWHAVFSGEEWHAAWCLRIEYVWGSNMFEDQICVRIEYQAACPIAFVICLDPNFQLWKWQWLSVMCCALFFSCESGSLKL